MLGSNGPLFNFWARWFLGSVRFFDLKQLDLNFETYTYYYTTCESVPVEIRSFGNVGVSIKGRFFVFFAYAFSLLKS